MHIDLEKTSTLTGAIIGAAVEVHRVMGPGLLESIYEKCLMRELVLAGLSVESQRLVPITYKGERFEETLRFDLLVQECVLVEIKAVEKILPVHKAQVLSYLKLLRVPVGLIFNFHDEKLVQGLARLIHPGATLPGEWSPFSPVQK